MSLVEAGLNGHYRLRLGHDLIVDVLPGNRLETRRRSPSSDSSLNHFLADQVIPRLLAHGGDHVLHAGAFRAGDKAILLMGSTGRGKSTLAASFDQAGLPLVGDDAMIISWANARPFAKSVYPSLRLLPDSIAALLPATVDTASVADYTPKRRVSLPIEASTAALSSKVAAIFAIGEPTTNSDIKVRRLTEAEACIDLVSNSFALDPSNIDGARNRLALASRLARTVMTFEIRYPRDYAKLPEVRDAILAHLP